MCRLGDHPHRAINRAGICRIFVGSHDTGDLVATEIVVAHSANRDVLRISR